MTVEIDMEQIEQQTSVIPVEAQALALPETDLPESAVQEAPIFGEGDDTPGQWLGTQSSALTAIDRLKATIDEETEKLEVRAVVDFDGFSQRKNRGLLELTRAMRLTQDIKNDPRVAPQLTLLRASLIRNQAALQIHLDAVREVSAIIARSIQEVESDGTYSLAIAGKRK
ncbi:hypothetical protein AB8A31_18505 [Tardiphaga sp. 804_B3_N1_9]|jgi:hypothetical protein|uniref:hypothetical protein n=1 Tax=Tardiphaga sp. 804_B3_N1_9 TaxID=3240786 RepID=UPI003F22F482